LIFFADEFKKAQSEISDEELEAGGKEKGRWVSILGRGTARLWLYGLDFFLYSTHQAPSCCSGFDWCNSLIASMT
jgi:hypothetical protein